MIIAAVGGMDFLLGLGMIFSLIAFDDNAQSPKDVKGIVLSLSWLVALMFFAVVFNVYALNFINAGY